MHGEVYEAHIALDERRKVRMSLSDRREG
ncbi:hypothetical protein RHECNPAF_1330092 [Rhizobium etli CNPAF512]|nr:hypothetical protein RHECNPAF_1330092 [Rhizobium etli CNPAF512]